ncbi:unnamed protein product [Eruca vesicaria subsp. sativa]|uniref:Uncharacterized protein n=1 Tax=Eruca vesicaria subsp. sativa TaxID=29727 RepID=A0ABC8KDG7_ERUVS|nr:unnamed protein product [Eruca vesicaria subsp. sativa]
MAVSQISFSELGPGRCAQIVVTRLLCFWKARNAKKGGELMGVAGFCFSVFCRLNLGFDYKSHSFAVLPFTNPNLSSVSEGSKKRHSLAELV